MTVWTTLQHVFVRRRPRLSPEDRDPGLRLLAETHARIRQEIEDRHRAQYLEDQESLWEQDTPRRRWGDL